MRFRLWSALLSGSPPAPGARVSSQDSDGRTRVLLVQDGGAGLSTARGLIEDGFDVVHERTGEGGFFRATTEKVGVVVLAAVLPGRSGLEVLAALRAQAVTTPVLVLCAEASVRDRVAALDAGADDCAELPVAPAELHARVRALARRGAIDPVRLCAGDLVLDPMARRARRGGRPLQLTVREFQLLEYLVRHQGDVVTRECLCRDLWQGRTRPALDNALDVHIARLRRKVDGDEPVRLIHTVRGVGFAFGVEPAGVTRTETRQA
jgi:two-component system, OmpR family, copper resistance phosphate regulon response regulator CusR